MKIGLLIVPKLLENYSFRNGRIKHITSKFSSKVHQCNITAAISMVVIIRHSFVGTLSINET